MGKPSTVTEYIQAAPKHAQKMLRELRAILKSVVPEASESLKWRNPVFEEKRILFAYAAYKNHINFMPTPAVIDAFRHELKEYATGKGSIQFPYDKKLPVSLIKNIATLRVKEVREHDAKWM